MPAQLAVKELPAINRQQREAAELANIDGQVAKEEIQPAQP